MGISKKMLFLCAPQFRRLLGGSGSSMSDHHIDPRNNTIAFTYGIFILGAIVLFLVSPLSPTSPFNSSSNNSFDYIGLVSAQVVLPQPAVPFPPAKLVSPAEPVPSAQDHIPGQSEVIVAASQPTTGESLLDIIFGSQYFILNVVSIFTIYIYTCYVYT
jgi:hypothetical protein